MNRLLSVMMAVCAFAQTYAGDTSEPMTLDIGTTPKSAGYTCGLTYDTLWQGVTNADYRILVNGTVLSSGSGAGAIAWSPRATGDYLLTYQAVVDGYKVGEMTAHLKVAGNDLSNADIQLETNETIADGSPKTPAVKVVYQEETLVEGVDYALSYEQNVEAGMGKVYIQGKGRFADVVERSFVIRPSSTCLVDIESGVRNASQSEILCSDVRWFGGVGSSYKICVDGREIAAGIGVGAVDWVPSASGEHLVTYRTYRAGSLESDEYRACFAVAGNDLVKANIVLSADAVFFDGTERRPSVTITYEDQVLVEGVDYTLEYCDNVSAGEGRIVIRGRGAFSDVVEKRFTIRPGGVCSLDIESGVRTASRAEPVCFDVNWFGDANCQYAIYDGANRIASGTGLGAVVWNPQTEGLHILRYRTYKDGNLVDGEYEAQFDFAGAVIRPDGGPYQETVGDIDWTFMVAGGESSVDRGLGASAISQVTSGEVDIPASLGGHPVVDVGALAFDGCGQITSLTIPASVTNLGANAFSGVTNLVQVVGLGAPPTGTVESRLFANYPNVSYPPEYEAEWIECLRQNSTNLFVTIAGGTNEVLAVGERRTIIMSCPDERAEIYYTLDGSEPATNSSRYASKFKISMGSDRIVIKAKAVFGPWQYFPVSTVAFAQGTCETPVCSMGDGEKFYRRNQAVVLSCPTEGATIRYTLDGMEPTEGSAVYSMPIVISETTTIKAKAVRDDIFESKVMSVTLIRDWHQVATPAVKVYDGPTREPLGMTTFSGSHVWIEIACATEGATVYYTTDGSAPTAASSVYTAPFKAFETVSVKTIAVRDDWVDSSVGEMTLTKETGVGDVLKDANTVFTNDADYPWVMDATVSFTGDASMRSGAAPDNGQSMLMTVVNGPGRVLFRWKADCEEDFYDHEFDHGEFMVDGEEAAERIDGATGWRAEDIRIEGAGAHTLVWIYQKDDCDEKGYDGGSIWLDAFVWIPDDGSKVTYRSDCEVPYNWLYGYGLLAEKLPEEAVLAGTGKKGSGGEPLTVEADFIAGTNPTNENSVFTAAIDLSEGYPKVTWDPDLNEDGTKMLRTYKVWGKEALDDGAAWVWPTNVLHRFFKVTVEMP